MFLPLTCCDDKAKPGRSRSSSAIPYTSAAQENIVRLPGVYRHAEPQPRATHISIRWHRFHSTETRSNHRPNFRLTYPKGRHHGSGHTHKLPSYLASRRHRKRRDHARYNHNRATLTTYTTTTIKWTKTHHGP